MSIVVRGLTLSLTKFMYSLKSYKELFSPLAPWRLSFSFPEPTHITWQLRTSALSRGRVNGRNGRCVTSTKSGSRIMGCIYTYVLVAQLIEKQPNTICGTFRLLGKWQRIKSCHISDSRAIFQNGGNLPSLSVCVCNLVERA